MPRIALSGAARRQALVLGDRYLERGYVEAFQKLERNISFAADPDNFKRHRFFAAPRPAPALEVLCFRWMIHNGYWFGYTLSEPPVIMAIIHGSADMVGQAAHLFPLADKG
jgi:hypothetical protein